MPVPPDQLFHTADIVETDASTGEIRAKVGNAAIGQGYAQGLPLYTTDGFIGRPNQPSPDGGACQAFYIVDGDGSVIVGTRDNRFADKVGSLEPGDRAIVTDGEARVLVKREDDAVFVMTENKETGKTMMLEMNGAAGIVQLFNGNCWISMSGDTITLNAGGEGGTTMLMLNAKGLHVFGANFFCGTGGGHFGYISPPANGAPGVAPPQGSNSVLVGPTGQGGAPSSKWTMTI